MCVNTISSLKIKTDLGLIHTQYIKHESTPLVCFFSGFASASSSGTKSQNLINLSKKNKNFSCLLFDYSGSGLSEGESYEHFSISEWYQNCSDVISHFTKPEEKIIIVGSSMGGWLSLLFAKRNPNKVSSMLCLAAAPDFTEEIEKEIKASSNPTYPFLLKENDFSYSISQKLIHDGKKNFITQNPSLEINIPITLIHGIQDKCVDYNTSLKIMRIISSNDAKVILLKNANHNLSDTNTLKIISLELNQLLLHFKQK